MNEAAIDSRSPASDPMVKLLEQEQDYLLTVCDSTNENFPVFLGDVKHYLPIGFGDSVQVAGSEEFIRSENFRFKDEMKKAFLQFYINQIKTP